MMDTPVNDGAAPAADKDGAARLRFADVARFADASERAARDLTAFSALAGGLAHDFRNILTIIDAGLRLAESKAGEPDAVRDFIAGARDGIGHGLALTARIMGFAVRQDFGVRATSLNTLLQDLELFLKYSAEPRLHVVLELAPNLPACLVDAAQFNAALINMVANARDAAREHGTVVISTHRCVIEPSATETLPAGTYVRVRVSDDGQGMTEEVMQHVFDAFFTTKGDHGVGLGLPQVWTLMRLVGGYVTLASKPGEGTTFDLFFPSVQSLRMDAHGASPLSAATEW